MKFVTVENGPVGLNVAVAGEGPLILCVHGWPELWYSWRHQIEYFSARGYTVAAMDVRGYGDSSRPHDITAYTMKELASDVAAAIDALGGGRAILFGHDWGAPIVWNTALLYPDKVSAVAGLSVPYIPRGEVAFLKIAEKIYADRFFYQLYFQQEGVAERELEADTAATLRKIYFMISGDNRQTGGFAKPAYAGMLDGLTDPDPFPAWLSDADLRIYTAAFEKSGFRGPLNRYRAQNIDFDELAPLKGKPIAQPACFIAGAGDPVRHFVPGVDTYTRAGDACTDFRGATLLPEIGHWVQQEAPDATNAALSQFLSKL